MKKLLRYTSPPSGEYQSHDDTYAWVGGGEQGAVFIDAIIGFEELEPCDKGARTNIFLVGGRSKMAMGSIDEWIQKVTVRSAD